MYEVKAIETEYNGYLFRSRTEARWAVFFDYIGEPYEYEKECFQLPSGKYLPDFFLPKKNLWVEIKGKEPTEKEWRKCVKLFELTGFPVVCLWGTPGKQEGRAVCNTEMPAGKEGIQCLNACTLMLDYSGVRIIVGIRGDQSRIRSTYNGSWERFDPFQYESPELHQYCLGCLTSQKYTEIYNEAVAYSRQARFEKGVKKPRGE